MALSHQETRDLICDICYKMWQQGWVAANDGNVTAKLPDGTFLATPTGISKSFITPEKLLRIDETGKVLEGEEGFRPSSEIKMHLRCYKERDDVGGVVHAHPPTATGYAVANKALDEYSMIETVIAIGSIPVTPYGTPSTDEVPEAIAPFLPEHDVLLLQNHGALTVGADVLTAYYRMETLELYAKISMNAHLLGGAQEISPENIDRLISMRAGYGVTGKHPGYKKFTAN
jgi:Ribulose-5-phosphate 4-epimerase and related epimerases and aldolases